jgi:nucleotidyltransferase/DNA polymerase involved in DNA repair
MSARAVAVLGEFSPQMEVYSIDECLLGLEGLEHLNLIEYGHEIRARMLRCSGLPVCAPAPCFTVFDSCFALDSPDISCASLLSAGARKTRRRTQRSVEEETP